MNIPSEWAVVRLRDIVLDTQPGFAQRPGEEEEEGATPQIRTHNVSPDGQIDLAGIKYVTFQGEESDRYRLKPQDIIFNNTNSEEWVGKTALFEEEGTYVFSNHMTRIRVNKQFVEPEYLARYLHFLWRAGYSRQRSKRWVSQARAFEYVGDGLLEALGGHTSHPFDHFKLLLGLHQEGLLQDIQIALRKTDTDDILLFDELSDGEQMFLGRMALFHLMQGQEDSLILLDEPETHFNDKWKREIVAIIDEVLSDTANAVLISTHSSIALTDVFHDEIVLFAKQDGEVKRIELASTTFGADPSEVMIRLFNVPDSVGQRAMKWLEQKLTEDYRSPEKREELIRLIDKVGPGFYRSELRAILKRLERNAASN